MIAERKDIEKYLADFEKKAEMAYRNYQDSGITSYDRSYRKNQDLAECLKIALQTDADRTSERERRAHNISKIAEALEEKEYTKKDVKKILLDIAYM